MTTPMSAQAKNHLKSQVKSLLAEQFSGGDTLNKSELLEVFWQQLAIADWAGKEVNDIAGCIDTLWSLYEGGGQSPIVRIFNPSMEVNGWLCSGTVIMIRQVDMPFLVDSIRLELNRRDISIHTIKSTLVAVETSKDGAVTKVADPSAKSVDTSLY